MISQRNRPRISRMGTDKGMSMRKKDGSRRLKPGLRTGRIAQSGEEGRDQAASGFADVVFPLTPSLSLGERETTSADCSVVESFWLEVNSWVGPRPNEELEKIKSKKEGIPATSGARRRIFE